ncbi:MAG TPA: hypothetical protein VH143_31480 [Kofleriaceae bacterium]|nr:hypothetical protein [Kofleriaceae bacterium]
MRRTSGPPVVVLENQIKTTSHRTGRSSFGAQSRTRLISVDVATGATHERHWDDSSVAFGCWTNAPGTLTCDAVGTLDATTLETLDPTRDRSVHIPDSGTCSTSPYATLATTRLHAVGDLIGIDEPPPADPYARHTELPPGTKTVELTGKPAFVTMPSRVDQPLTTPAGAIVVHSPDNVWMLSLVGPDGGARWTTAIGGACERAEIIGDVIVVATEGASPRALAIELATGNARWRVAAAR